jgi:hypothetical protein
MNLSVRIPASNGHAFTAEQARTAVGKPLLDRVGEPARRVGTVRAAHQERGDLVLTIEVDNVAVQYDLAKDVVNSVSLVPKPRVAAGSRYTRPMP